ncbi:MAG: hypothetical protein QG658_641 [Patescibacteria group bacterium]|jgi:thiol-disulfide isomerase/thioredoxin|nr:hypothetical protein [Patescibacteria group bacterium]
MKKPLIIGIVATVIVGTIIAAYAFLPKADTYSENNTNTGTTETSSPAASDTQSSPAANTSAGQYIDYSEDSISSTSGTKVLFFHAPWCPQCRELDASIKNGTIPAGVTIIKVDYDTSQALRQKYGVTTQTTLVRVDDSGNIVKKYVAYNDPSLEALIQNSL